MDEEKIIKEHTIETPEPVRPKIKTGEPQPERPDKFIGEIPEMTHISLAGYFGADLQTDKEHLKKIYEWAREESKSNDRGDILFTIRGLEQRLGIPKDINRINQVLNWIRLDRESQSIIKEKKAYER